MARFVVAISFTGMDNFVIDEPNVTTPEQAADLAWQKFKNGDAPDVLGNEYQEPDYARCLDDNECEVKLDQEKMEHAFTKELHYGE